MYIGHLFDPLHCKFATFMANDNARSAIFYWLALCRMVWAAVRAEECTAVRCLMQRAALAGAAHCIFFPVFLHPTSCRLALRFLWERKVFSMEA